MFGRPYPVIWMLEAGTGFTFMPWELEACAMSMPATAAMPTDDAALRKAIGDMRLYLRKMHGVDRAAFALPG